MLQLENEHRFKKEWKRERYLLAHGDDKGQGYWCSILTLLVSNRAFWVHSCIDNLGLAPPQWQRVEAMRWNVSDAVEGPFA